MIVYCAQFNVSSKLDIEKFINIAVEWVSNPKSHYNFPSFEWNGNEEQKIKTIDGKSELSIYVLIEKSTVAIQLKSIDQNDIEWINYYSLVNDKLYVSLEKNTSTDDFHIDMKFKLPYFLKLLFKNNLIEKNYEELNDLGNVTYIDSNNINIIHDLLTSINEYDLPVVYVTKYINSKSKFDYPIAINALSKRLLGIAYVLAESDTIVSQSLKETTNCLNPYNGAVQIFFKNGFTKRFLPESYNSQSKMFNDIFKIAFERNLSLKIDNEFTYSYITNEIYKIQIQNLKTSQSDADELRAEICLANKRIAEQNEEISRLKNDNYCCHSRIEALETTMYSSSDIPLLTRCELIETYDNEQFECIMDCLMDYLKTNSNPEYRSYDIISSIIDKNKSNYQGNKKNILDKVEKILSKRNNLNKEGLEDFRKLGFEIDNGEHYKIYLPNGTHSVTVAKTTSDKGHNTMNLLTEFKKMF